MLCRSLLLVWLIAILGILAPSIASGATTADLETRIKGFELVVPTLVGRLDPRTPEKHPENSNAYDGIASASPLAAEAGAGASGGAVPGLAQLPMDVAVPITAGEAIAIPRALAPSEMAALTNTTGNIEFSQTLSGGQYWLTRASFATPNRVQVLPWAADTVWLSHTHPVGYSGLPSAADRGILQLLGQGASRVVRPNGSSVRFGPGTRSDWKRTRTCGQRT